VPTRSCLRCRQLTSRPSRSGLCAECQAEAEAERPARAIYDSPRWRRLAGQVVLSWVRRHGWTCPGYERSAHRALDLTADHRVPLAAGGAPWDRANIGVLCRSCNGRKSAAPATRRAPA